MSTTSAASLWPTNGLGSLFDFAVASHQRALGLLIVASLMLFLPGFFQIPPVDRDEAYFAQATKQMIETGDYVDIRYQDDVRYRKPVGIYWLQAAVVKTAEALGVPDARTTIWLYRMPSLIGAIGAVLATYWCALAFVSRRGAVLAALMMAASTCSASKRGSPRPTPCCCSRSLSPWACWRASILRRGAAGRRAARLGGCWRSSGLRSRSAFSSRDRSS